MTLQNLKYDIGKLLESTEHINLTRTLKGMRRVWLCSTLGAEIFLSSKLISLLMSEHKILSLSYCWILKERLIL